MRFFQFVRWEEGGVGAAKCIWEGGTARSLDVLLLELVGRYSAPSDGELIHLGNGLERERLVLLLELA